LREFPAAIWPTASGRGSAVPDREIMRIAIPTKMRRILVAGAFLIAVALACASVYQFGSEFVAPAKAPLASSTAEIPTVTGGSSTPGLVFLEQPRELPAFQFTDEAGRTLSLADFRGRPILLNIWATWCVPCRKEMPSLDRLQSSIGKSQLLVLALSVDLQGAPAVRHFYEELGLHALDIYLDPASNSSRELKTVGLPTTLLIDRYGREIGRKIGAEEWDNPYLVAELQRHLGLQPANPPGPGGQ
jgi:thiol-disulfide isomerase/thioredoxin